MPISKQKRSERIRKDIYETMRNDRKQDYIQVPKRNPPAAPDASNSIADHKQNKNLFLPTDQIIVIQLLTEIRDELKKLNSK